MGKTKTLILTEAERTALKKAYRFESCHRFSYALQSRAYEGGGSFSSGYINFCGIHLGCDISVAETIQGAGSGLPARERRSRGETTDGLIRPACGGGSYKETAYEHQDCKGGMGKFLGEKGERPDLQTFFSSIDAIYKRIRKRQREKPSS